MLVDRFLLGTAFLVVGIEAQTTPPTTTRSQTSTTSSSLYFVTTGSETVTTASTSTDGPQTIEVKVGLAGFKYSPDSITANPGDTVRFRFYPPDHSVIRAAFGYPCIPWEYVHADGYSFDSGLQYVNTVSNTTTYDVLINDTQPIFYYCGAPNSCLGQGMIGVINPNNTETLQMQKDARAEYSIVLTPGQPWPTEGNPMETVSGLAITETGAAATSTSSAGSGSSDSSHHTMSAGAIAGIAIGGTALLVIIGVLVYFCGRRGGLEKGYRKSGYIGAANAGGQAPGGPMAEASPDMSKHVPSGVSQYSLGVNNTGSPPMSPGISTMGTSTQYGQPSPGTMNAMGLQYQQTTPPAQHPHMAPQPAEVPAPQPVELPASADPGNSPLPQYSNQAGNTYSWAPREEAEYRPSEK